MKVVNLDLFAPVQAKASSSNFSDKVSLHRALLEYKYHVLKKS